MNWNGIAPFNEPCELAPGWPEFQVERITVTGVCECGRTFTRIAAKGNANRVTTCGTKECKRERRILKRMAA